MLLSISNEQMNSLRQARTVALTVAAICYTLGLRTVEFGRFVGANGRKQALLTAVYYCLGFVIGFTRTIISAYRPVVSAKVRLYAPKARKAAARATVAAAQAVGRFYNAQLGESTLLPRYTPASVRAYRAAKYRSYFISHRASNLA